jgi:hypothetical protein
MDGWMDGEKVFLSWWHSVYVKVFSFCGRSNSINISESYPKEIFFNKKWKKKQKHQRTTYNEKKFATWNIWMKQKRQKMLCVVWQVKPFSVKIKKNLTTANGESNISHCVCVCVNKFCALLFSLPFLRNITQ